MADEIQRQPKSVLIPIPSYGFDPTESAIPWHKIVMHGHRVVFATPDGHPAQADIRMVTGVDLPFLLKNTLMADVAAVASYQQMAKTQEFLHPISYDQIRPGDYDALLLPGGHDKGMRLYLESSILQKAVATFFDQRKPVGAICHGTLLAGRSQSSLTGRSVLWGKKTTGLTYNQELIAYNLTRLWLGDYYRTYSVAMQDELVTYLQSASDYFPGPGNPIPTRRDSDNDLNPGFTVRDGKYLSARWPGDAHLFGNQFVDMIEEPVRRQETRV
jgi:putative intracellular protease/amidase